MSQHKNGAKSRSQKILYLSPENRALEPIPGQRRVLDNKFRQGSEADEIRTLDTWFGNLIDIPQRTGFRALNLVTDCTSGLVWARNLQRNLQLVFRATLIPNFR